jgi:hypothetical protein
MGLKKEKKSVFKKHFQKYSVVYLTFKDIKDLTFEEAYKNICDIISSVYKNILKIAVTFDGKKCWLKTG